MCDTRVVAIAFVIVIVVAIYIVVVLFLSVRMSVGPARPLVLYIRPSVKPVRFLGPSVPSYGGRVQHG